MNSSSGKLVPHKGKTQEKEVLQEKGIFKQRSQEQGGGTAREKVTGSPEESDFKKANIHQCQMLAEINRDNDQEEPIDQLENLCCFTSLLDTMG